MRHTPIPGFRYIQVQEIAPRYFPQVDEGKIVFISNRVPLENNTSSDWNVLLKGAQSRNVSSFASSARTLPCPRDCSKLRSGGESRTHWVGIVDHVGSTQNTVRMVH